MRKVQAGYALILAIMIIAAIMMLVTSLVNRVIGFGRLTHTLVDREQATLLALSGVQIAIGQLSQEPAEKEQKNQVTTELKKILPIINRWQKFDFSEEIDGVDGSCGIYVACEEGKININRLYDFSQKKFIKNGPLDGLKIMQMIGEKMPQVKSQFTQVLSELLKKREKPLYDLTEIFSDKQFKKLASYIFPSPSKELTMFDLFTLEADQSQLQPWVFSRSLNTVLEFKNHDKSDKEALYKRAEESKSIPPTLSPQQKWDKLLAPMYGKQYSNLVPEIGALLTPEFETSIFSVVSYGKFGNIMVKLYAIVQKIQEKSTNYCIKKIYWI